MHVVHPKIMTLIPTHYWLLDSTLKPLIDHWKIGSYQSPLISFLFDEGELRIHTKRVTEQRSHLFDAAIEHSNLDEAARQFTIAVEEVFKQSAVCVEGNKVCIPPGHFGRSKDNPFGNRSIHVPCVKAARNGEFNPIVTQMTNGLRLHTKQLRRLKAILTRQKHSTIMLVH